MANLGRELANFYNNTKKGRRILGNAKAKSTFDRYQAKGPQFQPGSGGMFGRLPDGSSPLQAASDEYQRNRKIGEGWRAGAAFQASQYQPGNYNSYSGPQYSLDEYMGETDNYMAAYKLNIGASRKRIEEQFQLAFADANTRESISQGVVQQLPGRLDAIYAGASQTIDAEGQHTLQQQQGHQLQSFESAGAGGADQKAAMQAAFASRKADVPLLAAGVTSQVNRQKGALGQAKFERQGELDRAVAEMEVQYAKEQGLAKRDWMMAQQSRRWSLDDRNFAAEQDRRLAWEAKQGDVDNFERDRLAAREDQVWAEDRAQDALISEEERSASQVAASYMGSNDSSIERAKAMRLANPENYAQMSQSQNLKEANAALAGTGKSIRSRWGFGFGVDSGKKSVKEIIAKLVKDGFPRAAAVFRMQHQGE